MLTAESFKIPLEKELKLRLITDEIAQCTDVESLREGLIDTTRLVATYQQLLEATLMGVLEKEVEDMLKG